MAGAYKIKIIMKYLPVIVLILVLLVSGCASLKISTEESYPFRAELDGTAVVKGEEVSFQGALSIVSRDKGSAQIYGPLGLVVYTMDISDGKARLYNVWGKKVREYDFPYEEFMGLMAGIPPDTPYLWKRSVEGGSSVSYLWGKLVLDKNTLPRKVHVKSSPPVNASFTQKGKIITLMMDHGSDKLDISMDVLEGGRWLKGSFGSE
jgi:hypothetical protein